MMVIKHTIFILLALLIGGCSSANRTDRHFEQQYHSPMMVQNGVKISNYSEIYGAHSSKKYNQKKSNSKTTQKIAFRGNSKKRAHLVKYAKKFNHYRRVPKPFRNDCSGFIRFLFHHIGIDPFQVAVVRKNGKWLSGTKLVYNYALKHGSVFKNWKKVRAGDLIFFDNTHDKNRNRKLDDLFTHIALVIGVYEDGTIEYIHKSGSGINIQKMNLIYPHTAYRRFKQGKITKKFKVNSYLRRRSRRDTSRTPHLSAEMFRSFGRIGR